MLFGKKRNIPFEYICVCQKIWPNERGLINALLCFLIIFICCDIIHIILTMKKKYLNIMDSVVVMSIMVNVFSYSYSNGIFNSRYINVKGDNPCSKLYGKALGIIGKIFFLFLRVKYYQLQLYLCLFIFKRHCHKSQE